MKGGRGSLGSTAGTARTRRGSKQLCGEPSRATAAVRLRFTSALDRRSVSVAFGLSGGASLGAIQVGMLRALVERRITPDLIIDTSIGALNGAYIASRPATPETVDALTDVWLGLHRFEIFPPGPITGMLGFMGLADHFFAQLWTAPDPASPPRDRAP